MPYVHYESFDKQTETRRIISIVDQSRELPRKRRGRALALIPSLAGLLSRGAEIAVMIC